MSNNLLEPDYWSIKQLFDCQYNVPVYQRPYSWQTEQVESLLKDIAEAYNEFKELEEENRYNCGLYIGNIILHNKSFNNFDIIDGQQRITTFSLLILALYCKSYELQADITDRIVQKLQAALWKLDGAELPIQEKKVITLGSVEKEMFSEILDFAFLNPKELKDYIMQYETKNNFENNIKVNFLSIYDDLTKKYKDSRGLLLFANFVLTKIYLISIITNGSEVKAFTIFESINSKGKKLDEIDLIKTHIFSQLKESDYKLYLSKWGDLIIKTNDNLYDYLKIYIKAYIKYYSQNISFNNFKKISEEICEYFHTDTISDAYKSLIDDMVIKVDYFRALFDIKKALDIIKDNKFKFYYLLYLRIGYEHPKPLFFRCFAEYNYGNGQLIKQDLISIIIETIKMMVSFLTICQKDSKDIINVFSQIFDYIYTTGKINKNYILYKIKTKLQTSGIRDEDIEKDLSQMDLYERNKKLGAAILSLFESRIENSKMKLSWDEAYSKFSTFGTSYSLDHIMNQTPELNDKNLKYYKLGDNLKLKENNDFPLDIVHEGMEYEDFKRLILHRIGNLRLKGIDGNSSRGNNSVENFCCYKDLNERTQIIVKFIMDNILKLEQIPSDYNPEKNLKNPKKIVGNFDFSVEDIDLTGIKIKNLTIFDKSYELSSNKEIIKYLVIYFYENNENEIIAMANNDWKPRKRIIISNSAKKLTTPYEIIKDKVYVETNLSSKDIFWYGKKILQTFKFPLDLATFYIPE